MRNRGDTQAALEKLKAAHALAHTPITGLELGRTYSATGQLVEARETLLSVARIPQRPEETSRSVAARRDSEQLADQLRPRIPSLTVKVTGVPSDAATVTIDGSVVPVEALAAPRLLDPGHHALSARSTGGGTAETTVELKEGENRGIELKITFANSTVASAAPLTAGASVTTSAATAPAPPASSRSHALEWALMGSGAGLIAVGVVTMASQVGKAQDAVTQVDRSAYDSAKTWWTVGLVGSIVGAAALASGGVVFAIRAGKDDGATSSATGASTWIRIGLNRLEIDGAW